MKYFKIILVFFLFLLNKTSFANENIVEILKKGGNIIFIRHAIAPGNGDPLNFDISDCSTQRNLSKDGELQALKIGKFFKDYPLPFAIGILLLAGKNPDPNIGNSRGPMPSFRDGTFRILDYETAEVKAAQLVKMKSFIPQLIRISKFCAAFLKVSTLEKFSITTCYAQMKKYNIRFGHPGNLEEWIEQFVDVYNYRIAKSKKLSLRVEGF